MNNTKQKRCKYCHISIRDYPISHCVVEGWDDDKVRIVTEEDCDRCEKFESMYIEFPLTINSIENKDITPDFHNCGKLCEIRPCGDEYKDKTYLGIYLGRLPVSISSYLDKKTKTLINSAITNPAIFVPELNKIIYGYESWWRKIDAKEDFKEITDEDIEKTWYVKIFRAQKEDTE